MRIGLCAITFQHTCACFVCSAITLADGYGNRDLAYGNYLKYLGLAGVRHTRAAGGSGDDASFGIQCLRVCVHGAMLRLSPSLRDGNVRQLGKWYVTHMVIIKCAVQNGFACMCVRSFTLPMDAISGTSAGC